MACVTCSHTLQMVFLDANRKIYHCPRCGTLCETMRDGVLGRTEDTVPSLVERCRKFAAMFPGTCNVYMDQWHRLGIAEAINLPESRS